MMTFPKQLAISYL